MKQNVVINRDFFARLIDIFIRLFGRIKRLIHLIVAIRPSIVTSNPRCRVRTLYEKMIIIPTMVVIHAARNVNPGLLIKSSRSFFIEEGFISVHNPIAK